MTFEAVFEPLLFSSMYSSIISPGLTTPSSFPILLFVLSSSMVWLLYKIGPTTSGESDLIQRMVFCKSDFFELAVAVVTSPQIAGNEKG